MDFTLLTLITAAIQSLLGFIWVFKGQLMLARWGLEPSNVALLVGRKMGVVYIGVAFLATSLSAALTTEGQKAFSLGAATITTLLALIGLYEFVRRRVGAAILISVAVELVLAACYFSILINV